MLEENFVLYPWLLPAVSAAFRTTASSRQEGQDSHDDFRPKVSCEQLATGKEKENGWRVMPISGGLVTELWLIMFAQENLSVYQVVGQVTCT